MKPRRPPSTPARPSRVVPILDERATVSVVREEIGAVRVRVETDEVPAHLGLDTATDTVDIERVPIGMPVDARRPARIEDGVIVVPVYEEVVERRLVLKEEIRLVPRRTVERMQPGATLRREHAIVERRGTDGTWQRIDAGEPPRQARSGIRSDDGEGDDTRGQRPADPSSDRSDPS